MMNYNFHAIATHLYLFPDSSFLIPRTDCTIAFLSDSDFNFIPVQIIITR
jgi:hypothetical protein